MQTFSIPINEVAQIRKRDAQFCINPESFKPYLSVLPKLENFSKLIEARKKFPDEIRNVLHSVLTEQHSNLTIHEAVKENIQKLESSETFTITTAHQPVIYGGPLYVLLKALSAISLCAALKKNHPNHNFVPIYWLGGEDDDFEEVNHTYLFNNKIEWKGTAGGSVGPMILENIESSNLELKNILGDSQEGQKWGKVIDNCYGKNRTLNDATRLFLYELLGHLGLVILDPDNEKLKGFLKPIIKDEFKNQSGLKHTLSNIESIKKTLGYKAQANPRAINFFIRSINGRNRIEIEDGAFHFNGQSYTLDQINSIIDEHPEKFSPNVIYRPVYQELILPNLAYVGGGGELAYWTERKFLFDHFNLPFPMLVRRQSAAILNAANLKKIEKLGLSISDLFNEKDLAAAKLTQAGMGSSFSGDHHRGQLKILFEKIKDEVIAQDTTLAQSVDAELSKAFKSIDAIESKIKRNVKRNNEDKFKSLEKLFEKSFPGGVLGERQQNILQNVLISHNFISDLQTAILPLSSQNFIVMIS